jgi:monovalent cation/hydrogen antiporter
VLDWRRAVRSATRRCLLLGLELVVVLGAAVLVCGLVMSQLTPRVGQPETRQQTQAFLSLTTALAVPETVASGHAFPDRDMIIFVTSGVIVVTLVLQGLLMPVVVRWARLPHDGSVDAERHLAQIQATEEAIAAIPQLAADLDTDAAITERLRHEYEKHLRVLHAGDDGADDEPALQYDRQYTALRQAVLARKRATVLRLRDERRIDDIVLRQIQARLDVEEVRLSRRELAE